MTASFVKHIPTAARREAGWEGLRKRLRYLLGWLVQKRTAVKQQESENKCQNICSHETVTTQAERVEIIFNAKNRNIMNK